MGNHLVPGIPDVSKLEGLAPLFLGQLGSDFQGCGMHLHRQPQRKRYTAPAGFIDVDKNNRTHWHELQYPVRYINQFDCPAETDFPAMRDSPESLGCIPLAV
jgi:hypothetical protein